ncbi:MAG TPA: restriction endonuclease subunit S, partial [Pyrinomonadaceae bacterium]
MNLQAIFDNFDSLLDAPNSTKMIRRMILNLAFLGELVPQLPDEGTARALLKRIESVKNAQVNNGKAEKLPPFNPDETQYELPITWEWVRLGHVVEYDCAQKVTPHQINDDSWLLQLEDIEKDSSRIIQKLTFADRKSKSAKAKFAAGDVLYGKLRPYLNKVIIADEDGYCTTEIVALRGYFGIESRFLMYALKRPQFIAYINAKSYGVKMPRLGSDDARLSPFPLPPLEEQKRIATKIDE